MAGVLGTIKGQVFLDIRQAVGAYAALRAQNQRTVYALRGTGDSFVQAGQQMAMAGAVMVYGFAKVVNAAAEFERKMDFASAVSGATAKQMQRLSDYALKLGQDTIYSAGEIAEGFIELAKAGVSAEQIMHGVGKAMANLGAAGDIPLMESGQIITSTIQQFDLAARDAVKVTDLLAGAANASIADITDIGVSLKYVGGVANAVGLTVADTTTAISLLAKAGIRGSTAGTSLRQMLVSLGGATGPARESLKALGIMTEDGGNKFFTTEGNAKSLSKVFQILQSSTEDLTAKERLMHLRTIFNNRALAAAAILTREGAKGFKAMSKEMSKTTAADVASERLDNLSGDLEILRGNLETMMIKAGTPFQKELRKWVQSITKLVQAFAALDPETQESILRFIALSGVALVAMGVFSILVGTVFRFIAAMLKMKAAIKFVVSILRTLITNLRWAVVLFGGELAAALGVTMGVFLLIIAVVVAFIAAWVLAYKKIEVFRNAVNTWRDAILKAAEAFGDFIKLLFTDPSAAWEQWKSGIKSMVKTIENGVKKLPGIFQSAWDRATQATADFVSDVKQKFIDLGSRLVSTVSRFIGRVLGWFSFQNIGNVIGTVVGTVVSLFTGLGLRMVTLAMQAVTGVLKFFSKLPGKVGYFIGYMLGRVVGFFLKMHQRMQNLAGRAVQAVIRWFQKLPGRIAAFVASMVARGIALFSKFAREAPGFAGRTVTGVIDWVRQLPGKVAGFVVNMVTRAMGLFRTWKTNAVNLAKGMFTGFTNAIADLPSTVSNIASEMIQAIKDQITSAFNAVRDFAAGMWNGFKDGIGMHSPSHLERAMWQITGVMDKETKKIAKKTMEVQALSRRMAQTTFSVGDPGVPKSAQSYRRLASMQSRNQNRARTLLANSGNAKARALAASKGRKTRLEKVRMRIDNWQQGTGYLMGLAQEAVDNTDYYDETFERMG